MRLAGALVIPKEAEFSLHSANKGSAISVPALTTFQVARVERQKLWDRTGQELN
jgi:hypothetical protein